jgi:Protein of unknown function (DUF3558)
MRRGHRKLLVAASLIASLTACSSSSGPPSQAPILTTDSARSPSPAVANPRDGSAYATRPCSLLSAAELHGLGLNFPGRQRATIDVQRCDWSSASLNRLAMYVDPARDLLADTYRTWRGVLIPTTVEGMPAARQKSGQGEGNICTVTTALGPKQALETTWIGTGDPRSGNDACEFAEQATALVIRKLPLQR